MLRHHALSVPGLRVVPQTTIRDGAFAVRPDLVDPHLRIVLEADSHAFHATRAALRRDCRRSTGLAIRGWLLIRFSWEDVMLDPDYVVTSLRSAVSLLAAA